MAGNTFGTNFTVTTWGESHGKAVGAVVDGCPAGISLCEDDIQKYLDRRKPGQSAMTTARAEDDRAEILSGVFEGKTTGTPISVLVWNKDQHSKDYSEIAHAFRPGHADFPYYEKYGIRDYRGGGRSSGRETIGRVIGGAIAAKCLDAVGISACAYVKSVGAITAETMDFDEIPRNPLFMPDKEAAERAVLYVKECREKNESVGGIVECRIFGMPVGIGEPVFSKLDALLARAVLSIGGVKGFEIGSGFSAATMHGSEHNDAFYAMENSGDAATRRETDHTKGKIQKQTNHAGGILGGMSDGSEIVLRAAFKPTPSIAKPQSTVNESGEPVEMTIKGRHDPVIMPRAAVVVEAMANLVVADLLYADMTSKIEDIVRKYGREND